MFLLLTLVQMMLATTIKMVRKASRAKRTRICKANSDAVTIGYNQSIIMKAGLVCFKRPAYLIYHELIQRVANEAPLQVNKSFI